jgi:cytochrome c553
MRRMMLNGSLVLTALVTIALCSLSWGQATKAEEDQRLGMESHIGKLTGHATSAQGNYRRYCVGCHGELGDGEGENAQWLEPKPRNFTLGIFKCRSTTTGTLPLDSDLFDTIGRGLDS